MRISDWSSDVCSSDLCGGIGRRGRLKICYPQGCGSSSLPGGTSQRPVDPCPGHLEANDMTKTARLMLFAALPLAVSGCALGHGHRPVPVAAQLACPAGAESWRSEEHTSELQSLMRISYAVFCLKKNNRKGKR